MAKRRVAIGLVGSTLDAGKSGKRWQRWRPTIALCTQPELPLDRLELVHQPRTLELAQLLASDLGKVAPSTEVRLHELSFADPWDFEEVYAALHDFARRYPFAPSREEYLVHITTGTHVAQICLFLLTEARYLPARLIQTSSPARGQEGTTGTHRVIDLDLSRYDALARRFAAEQVEARSFLKQGIETKNASFNALIDRIETVAILSRDPILLMGPTGAGKSQLARRIYELKKRRQQVEGAFVEVNCATLRGEMAMSALFGHERGSFTGAASARKGLLRAAHLGVLFLDEIGELGPDEQAMLLRAIEHKRFLPVGADREVESDFTLFAGTNRDLRARARDGRFRDDLLARIDLWTFELPGLAARTEDVEPNLAYELERASDRLGRRITMNREAHKRFLGFATSAPWLANFRDLNAAVTRMATLADGGRIDVPTVDDEIARLERAWSGGAPGRGADHLSRVLGADAARLDRFDRAQLAEVLAACAACRTLSEAGRALFAESRKAQELRQRRRPPAQVPRALRAHVRARARASVGGIDWMIVRGVQDAACDAQYRAYNACLAERGGTQDVSCAVESTSFSYCVAYVGLANDPEATCDSLSGSVVTECATTDVVGVCEAEFSGVTVITTYYGPLSPGVSPDIFANACVENGGTWSTP